MVTESEFSKAVDEFKLVLKDESMTDKIENISGIDKAINSLNGYVRVEFREFAAIPDSLLKIQDHIKDFRNWKQKNDPGFDYVNNQKDLTVSLIKNYLEDVSRRQNFKTITW